MQDRRAEVRMLCADLVEVCWQDEQRRPQQTTALLEDISRAGACLQLEMPIPTGASLRILCGTDHLEGTVRYCMYREIGYMVGVRFAAGSEWSRVEFEPDHLLDPEKLTQPKTPRVGKRVN